MSWQRTVRIGLFLIALFVVACGDPEPDSVREGPNSITHGDVDDLPPFTGAVVVNDANLAVEHWGDDPYELGTGDDAPVLEGDILTLTLSYSGGCARHDFTLVTAGYFLESNPVQLNLHLVHDAHEDPCEAYPTEQYEFDLAPLRMLYQDAYRRDEGVIILRLHGPAPSRRFPNQGFAFPVSYAFE